MAGKKTTKKSKSSLEKKKRSFFVSALKWGLVMGIWGMIAMIGVIAYYCHDLPDIASAAEFNRKRSITVYANDNKTVIGRYGELLGENVTYEELPPQLISAVLATEDRRFFYHFGVDPIGILRAVYANMQKSRIAQGGSTITQQLAKNMFLSSERTIKRKIQEAILALWLESRFTKKEILAAYLNRVYMGGGAYGVDAAAQVYFQKPVGALSREESAILAGLLKAPSRYNPKSNPKQSRERMQLVLKLMEENPPLGLEEQEVSQGGKMAKNNIILPPQKPFNITHSFEETRYFTDWVIERLPEYINSPDQDLAVYTTLDLKLQKDAQSAALKLTQEYVEGKTNKKAPEFAAILAKKDGAVTTMLGGSDYTKSQFNRATQAMRQPGSSFKPFVYLTALKQGRDLNDYIDDTPFSKNGYAPENYNGEFHGRVPLWEALMNSYNVASVRLLDEVTPAPVIDTARKLGITSTMQPDLSIALGTSETTLLQMVQAYHNISRFRQGEVPLYAIKKIEITGGQTLYERENATPQSVSFSAFGREEHQMEQLIAMMQAVVQYGTGRRADLGYPVAGKTGTSQNNRDAWFLGFTSDYTAGVWVGYDNNDEMPNVYGGTIPASIWKSIVSDAQNGSRGGALVSRNYQFEYKNELFAQDFSSSFFRSGAKQQDSDTPNRMRFESQPLPPEYQNHPKTNKNSEPYQTRLGNNPNSL